jgi:coenzyme PQQ precursor peptide PqqA
MLAIGVCCQQAETRDGRKRTSLIASFTSSEQLRSKVMKWETPKASDMRYGFEITMYIATR